MSNRVSKYLDTSKLVPSMEPANTTFDDFMIRRMASTLQAMMREGLGTKQQLLEKYSDRMFSVGGPQYCPSRAIAGTIVAPYRVFQWSRSKSRGFQAAVNRIISDTLSNPVEQQDCLDSWNLIFSAFAMSDLFIVWRMAWGNEEDELDRADDVLLIYGAFCNANDTDTNSSQVAKRRTTFSSANAGIISGSAMSVMISNGMLTYMSDLA